MKTQTEILARIAELRDEENKLREKYNKNQNPTYENFINEVQHEIKELEWVLK